MSIVKLETNDGVIYDVDIDIAKRFHTLKTMLDCCMSSGWNGITPLPEVNSATLKRILIWAEFHSPEFKGDCASDAEQNTTDDICPWDKEFLNIDHNSLFQLILAANYLDIKELLTTACKSVAGMIKGKSPEEIRNLFAIRNDFTEAEEQSFRRQNIWCTEDGNY